MTTQKIMQLFVLCIVLLAGIALVQYFQLKQQKVSAEDLKAQILAELRGGADSKTLSPAEQPVEYLNQDDTGNRRQEELVDPAPPAEPLSQNEYWISTDYSDDKPYGFSGWVELVPGGHFILEHCFSPDYSAEVTAEQDPYQSPTCKTLVDTRIIKISDTEIVLKNEVSIPMSLDVSAPIQMLLITIGNNKINLTPGQKNTLWEGLSSLPSIRLAHKEAWEKHVELRGELEALKE